VEVVGRWSDLPTEQEIDVGDAEVVLAYGGGSTIDTGKATSARTGLPLVSVPTTYSGAEWTKFFGVRDRDRTCTAVVAVPTTRRSSTTST